VEMRSIWPPSELGKYLGGLFESSRLTLTAPTMRVAAPAAAVTAATVSALGRNTSITRDSPVSHGRNSKMTATLESFRS
jgi:hypothetical protein